MNKNVVICERCEGSGFCRCSECSNFFRRNGHYGTLCYECKGRGTFDWIDFIHGRVPKSMVKELM